MDCETRSLGQLTDTARRRGRTLVCIARAHADVADVASFYDVVEGLHGFLDGRVVVESVTLEYIDVVELQSLQARFNSGEDVLGAIIVSLTFDPDADVLTLRLRPHWFTNPILSGSTPAATRFIVVSFRR